MIDTHVHLTWPTYEGRVDEIVERARQAGVVGLVDLGTDVATSRRAREHAHTYEGVYFAAGVHPNDAGVAKPGDLAAIEELIGDPRCVAVGEIGLDFYRDHTDPEIQVRWLSDQLALARKRGKPVVLHDRKASERLLDVLSSSSYDGLDGPGGVFHCFAGNVGMAREVVARGFYISFTGNVTFKKSDRPEVVKEVPLDRILLETDSPFMAPVPRRGRENEPGYLPYVAAAIAAAKGISLQEVVEKTTGNAIRLFGLPGLPGGTSC